MKKKRLKTGNFPKKKGEEISIPKFGEGEKISIFGQNIHPWHKVTTGSYDLAVIHINSYEE